MFHIIAFVSVLDSTGKTPDGVLGDVTHFCTFMDEWVQQGFCSTLSDQDQDQVNDLVIPSGNTIAMGSWEGCWKVESVRNTSDDSNWQGFMGKQCMVRLVGRSGDENEDRKRMMEGYMESYKYSATDISPQFGALPWIIGELFPDGQMPDVSFESYF